MENLDIILEGAVLGTEMDLMEAAKPIDTKQAANAFNEYSAGINKEAAYYTGILDDISRKANNKDIKAAAENGKSSIKQAVLTDLANFKKSVKTTEEKYKYKPKYSGNVASEESEAATKKREEAFQNALTKVKNDSGIVQTSNTVKTCAKVMKAFSTKAKGSEVATKAMKEATYTDAKGNKKSFVQVVAAAEKNDKEVKKAESIAKKSIDAINNKLKPMYESFKGELTEPSKKGAALAVVGALASYGVLYGALKGARIEGLGSIINPVSTVKLAIKVAASPSTYGVGKSILMGTILTILLGALSIAGTMAFNLIKAKFKK